MLRKTAGRAGTVAAGRSLVSGRGGQSRRCGQIEQDRLQHRQDVMDPADVVNTGRFRHMTGGRVISETPNQGHGNSRERNPCAVSLLRATCGSRPVDGDGGRGTRAVAAV